MIETFALELPHGITLSCRAAGPLDAPRLAFLHGFPEGAFVWDPLLLRFAGKWRAIAPNLRGYERSSQPREVDAYRTDALVSDLVALAGLQSEPLEALVGHDWGGVLAWTFAALHPEKLKRLVIINAPHPAAFLRELRDNPAQQAASAYMNFLCRPDAEALLAESDYARLWPFFDRMGASDPRHPGGAWLTDAVKEQYRALWHHGLSGALNYYRASPLKPPTASERAVMSFELARETLRVSVPTHVVWAEADAALPMALLDGLVAFAPDLRVVRVPHATHWIVHERPEFVAVQIESALAR